MLVKGLQAILPMIPILAQGIKQSTTCCCSKFQSIAFNNKFSVFKHKNKYFFRGWSFNFRLLYSVLYYMNRC